MTQTFIAMMIIVPGCLWGLIHYFKPFQILTVRNVNGEVTHHKEDIFQSADPNYHIHATDDPGF